MVFIGNLFYFLIGIFDNDQTVRKYPKTEKSLRVKVNKRTQSRIQNKVKWLLFIHLISYPFYC